MKNKELSLRGILKEFSVEFSFDRTLDEIEAYYNKRRLSVVEIYHYLLNGKISWYETATVIFKAQEEKLDK